MGPCPQAASRNPWLTKDREMTSLANRTFKKILWIFLGKKNEEQIFTSGYSSKESAIGAYMGKKKNVCIYIYIMQFWCRLERIYWSSRIKRICKTLQRVKSLWVPCSLALYCTPRCIIPKYLEWKIRSRHNRLTCWLAVKVSDKKKLNNLQWNNQEVFVCFGVGRL